MYRPPRPPLLHRPPRTSANALKEYEKKLSEGCEGGANGGCLDKPTGEEVEFKTKAGERVAGGGGGEPAKPKAGAAPAALGKALELAKQKAKEKEEQEKIRPAYARGSFAEMAAGY